MATLRKIRRLPKRNAESVTFAQMERSTHHTWKMSYYNPKARKRIKKAKKLAKHNRVHT